MTNHADMDDVLSAISDKLEVGCESGTTSDHYSKYKNYGAEEKCQRERRADWLKRQREGRSELFEKRRSNVNREGEEMSVATSSEDNLNNNEDSNLVEMQDTSSDKQKSPTKPGSWKSHMHKEKLQRVEFQNRLMYGEWLIDLPEDFASEWRIVPTPKAKRCLIVFDQNFCTMFNKNGGTIHKISISTRISPPAICDGLVKGTIAYILDFIDIKPYEIETCDFDCRRFLGKSFLTDNQILEATDKNSKWSFELLEATPDCKRETIERFASEPSTFKQDGLMFYHREGLYSRGVTPLVNWLKPWMLAGQEGSLLSVMDGTSNRGLKMTLKIGIIGGTGLEDPDIFENAREIKVTTPYGEPSDVLKEGTIRGVPCVLVSRHSRSHSIGPSEINYRANIWALKDAGVNCILASNASGSLVKEVKPGDLVFPNSFIDRTTKRVQTFYDNEPGHLHGVCHIPVHPAYSEPLRQALIKTAKQLEIDHHPTGVILCIEGPRYSSRAESLMFKQWGATVINMTCVPELILAREIGLPYATVALSTDYDCWNDEAEHVSVDLVYRMLRENGKKATRLFVETIANIAKEPEIYLNDYEETQKLAKAAVM
ncbi:S-methyl-5'-thioadenosine phosphorylase [Aphelenchoides bicaudatus]|nr:S-methyl-5'-thioadenosine phosphorylase [Aphelenchoides bicaudatus]